MNYHHIYHAGNFADVMKHSILTLLMEYLHKKDSAYTYIDTHTGRGLYDLTSDEALKTQEAEDGIIKLFHSKTPAPALLQPYLTCVRSAQTTPGITHYPGSPWIARYFARPQDLLVLNEKHETTYRTLKKLFKNDMQVAIHKRDAYEFLNSMLPPKTSRGLILIDPPFEKTTEREDIANTLVKCLKRFRQGVYLIWFALTDKQPHFQIDQVMHDILQSHPHLLVEMRPGLPADATGLIGSLVLILNPPYLLEESLNSIMPYLTTVLSAPRPGTWRSYR